MTKPETVEDKIKEFILKHFPLARKNGFHPGEKWLESGLVDSLGILDLVSFLETEFSITVSDEDLLPENFQSLETVAEFVRKKS
jgi:acyl carrier protein